MSYLPALCWAEAIRCAMRVHSTHALTDIGAEVTADVVVVEVMTAEHSQYRDVLTQLLEHVLLAAVKQLNRGTALP